MSTPGHDASVARRRRRPRAWLAGLAVLAAVALVLLPNIPRPRFLEAWPGADAGWEAWRPLYRGVALARASFSRPRPMRAVAVRIELSEPGVEAVVKEDDGTGWTWTEYPSSFLRRHRLQVAMTSGSFHPSPYLPGKRVHLDGLGITDGRTYSAQAPNLDSLLILPGGHARLYRHGEPATNHAAALAGVGGMWITLRDGVNMHEDLPPEAASVCGVSLDGRTLYWLIVDGRQPGLSEGATPEETAEMLRTLGAHEALNMDGGSVATLVTDDGWRGFRLRNRPCHPVWTGLQRPVGGLIGFRARPLP